MFVEYIFVHTSGKSEANQLGADSNEKIKGLSLLADVIHESGALAGLQLVHTGGKTTTALAETHLMGPSAIATPV